MNILFLMTDQHRADHVSFLPGGRCPTPNIDRIAATAAFANCVSVAPVCTPARCALLTGKYPHQISMLAMSGDLSVQHPTYMRALQQAGYWTAAVGKLHWLQGWPWSTPRRAGHDLVALKPRLQDFGLDYLWEVAGKQLACKNYCDYAAHLDAQGLLDRYIDHVTARGPNLADARAVTFTGEPWPFDEADYVDNVTGDQVLAALRDRPRDRPFCLFGSFCGPHKPYDPPASDLAATPLDETDDFVGAGAALEPAHKAHMYRLRRAYRAMIRCIDRQVGRILDYLDAEGLADDTLVLFTADHGEMLGDHARMSKLSPLRQSVIVPTAIRVPGRATRHVVYDPIELIDLTATLLDVAAGLDPQAALSKPWPAFHDRVPCRSLRPYLQDELPTTPTRGEAFAECSGREGLWYAVRSATHQYVRAAGRDTLFDLAADPDSLHDLAADPDQADTLAGLRAALTARLADYPPAQLQWAPYGPRI